MGDRTSVEMFDTWLEAAQKFDYFLAGISIAVTGYLGQSFRPGILGWNPSLIEMLSMVSFIVATIAALKRIESSVHSLRVSQAQAEKREYAIDLGRAIDSGVQLSISSTGQALSPIEVQSAKDINEEMVSGAEKILTKIGRSTRRWYAVRTWALILGFLLLVAARLWEPYANAL